MSGYDRGLVSDQVFMGAGDPAKDLSHSGAERCENTEWQWRQQSPRNRVLVREHVKAEDT